MTKEEIRKELQNCVDKYIDDMLFYLSEYRDDLDQNLIADIFAEEFSKTVHQEVKEINEDI